ncbi:hypothetical protein FRC02_011052, partial [Tulasnella sp. 418]
MDLVLAYRVLCLYRLNRKLLWINVVAFLLCATTSFIVICVAVPLYEVIATPEHLSGCWAINPAWDFAALGPGLLYELWLFGLVSFKVVSYVRSYGSGHIQGILHVLVKDSSIWFFIVAGSILWNLIEISVSPRGLKGVAFPALRTIIIICGCRLILHLRKAYFKQAKEGLVTQGNTTHVHETGQARTFGGTPRNPADSQEERAKRAIELAQKIGLPPITDNELGSWDEEEIKRGNGSREPSSSPRHSDSNLPGHKIKKTKRRSRRDVEEGQNDRGTEVVVTSSEPPDSYEMVR